ncbi:hypothetical protein IWQ62_005119 [Dispira parvispora]|uniref:Very-long-chain (3R)-3-hydroxyacyl-CoA dehydratase n=1 Tax=Dispira parvispora TaxID=1520584 RepID=A0A9W8E5I9_9FUNG|nr:hypothetical protein IWQ62_005119 [Dispira parvispora]
MANPSRLIQVYLLAYNVVSATSWAWLLWVTLFTLATSGGSHQAVYDAVVGPLTVIQFAMLLDVVHAVLGFVRTPIVTSAIQVASRVLIVILTLQWFNVPAVTQSTAVSTMLVAWSVTEVIRYGYYACSLLGMQSYLLTWARYTFFFILYPLGAGSEATLLYKTLPTVKLYSSPLYLTFWFLLMLYLPLFPQMYLHMVGQRKKVLQRSKVTSASTPTSRRPRAASSTPIKKKI